MTMANFPNDNLSNSIAKISLTKLQDLISKFILRFGLMVKVRLNFFSFILFFKILMFKMDTVYCPAITYLGKSL